MSYKLPNTADEFLQFVLSYTGEPNLQRFLEHCHFVITSEVMPRHAATSDRWIEDNLPWLIEHIHDVGYFSEERRDRIDFRIFGISYCTLSHDSFYQIIKREFLGDPAL